MFPLLDVLPLIFASPDLDQVTLFHCSLVSKVFNYAASKALYRRVVHSPEFQLVLDLREDVNSSQYRVLRSSALPQYAIHVSELVVNGYLSSRPPPRNPLGPLLTAAVRAYTNLRAVTLTPQAFHPDVFTDVLRALSDPASARVAPLQKLAVNASCADATRAPLVVEIDGLRELDLHDPTRAILQLLPDWLGKLSPTLVALHLWGNCGSITPGVLRSFLPHVQHIRSFALGLSYSLTDEDVFAFLGQLPRLESLDLQYYLQLRSPAKIPALPNLRSFTIRHQYIRKRRDADRLCVWVRRAIARSPLEHLHMVCEHPADGPNISFDSLVHHLVHRHSQTMRSLRMESAFVGLDALRSLGERCVVLEVLAVSLDGRTLQVFKDLIHNMKKLHTARFNVRNMRRSKLDLEIPKAAQIIQTPDMSALRRLSINHVHWEGSWVSSGASGAKWIVKDSRDGD